MIKKQILLDTNFILSCIREKLDLFEYLEERNFKIIIPKQVIDEIKEIQNSKKKFKYKNEAEIALRIFEKEYFEEIDLKDTNADRGIIKHSKENPDLIIATLDKGIATQINNKKAIIRNKKRIDII